MSLRSAARLARPLRSSVAASAASKRAPAITRRYASSESHGSSSDRVWVLGAAAVWIPLGAYLSFSGPEDAHHVSHPKADAATDQYGNTGVQAMYKDPKHDAPATKDEPEASEESTPETKDEGEEPSAQDIKESLQQAEKSAVPKAAADAEAKGDTPESSGGEEKSEEAGGEEASGDAPSDQKVEDSLHQAEDAAVPKAAMSK